MRKVILFIIVIIIQGCSLLKQTPLSLNGACYVSKLGPMVGNSTISFGDSTFVYTERGGLFEGVGKWKLSPNGKIVIMKCVINAQNTDLTLEQNRYFELKIKGKDKLVSDTEKFIRKE